MFSDNHEKTEEIIIWVIKSNIIKKLILHAVPKCVTVYNNDVAKLFFLSKRLPR